MSDWGRTGSIQDAVRRQAGDAGADDAQLLELFRERRDESAFAELVRRHGGTVLGAARAVLRDGPDAEDVFQATFLVLALKAGEVHKPGSLASWLYGVARRIALDCRRRAARRTRHERNYGATRSEGSVSGPDRDDLSASLSEELARLPEKYRAPLVLCYLEGKTNEQAAAELRWPAGTVRGRIARGRDILRARLSRRGVSLTGEAVAAALAGGKLLAAAPPGLASATVRVAGALGRASAAPEVVSSGVAQLVQGALRAMSFAKIKRACVVLLALSVAIGISCTVAAWPWRKPVPQQQQEKDPDAVARHAGSAEEPDGDEKLRQLARVEVPAQPTSLTWSPDGKYIAAGTWLRDNAAPLKAAPSPVYVIDVAKEAQTTTLQLKTWVTALAFSADGKWLAVGTTYQERTLRGAELVVFDVPGFTPQFRATAGSTGGFADLCWAPDSQTLYALDLPSEYDDKAAVRRWSVPDFREGPAITTPQTITYKSIAVSADGRTLAVVDQIKIGPGVVRLYDAEGEERSAIKSDDISSETTARVGFTPDGKTVGVLAFDGRLGWWDVATGRRTEPEPGQGPFRFGTPFPGRSHHPAYEAFSPDGRQRLRGREMHSVILFDRSPPETYGLFLDLKDLVTDKERTWRIYEPTGSPPAVAFSPDGKRFAAAVGFPDNGTIVLYATPK
jgi:RNA polymerase sigma factor (sigma-70 family)